MSNQLDLFDPRPVPSQIDQRVPSLLAHLRGSGWRTRREISAAMGWDDRTIRAVVEASGGQIIAGQRGYKLTHEATREEFEHSCRALQSQIQANSARLSAQRRYFHRGPVPSKLSGYGTGL